MSRKLFKLASLLKNQALDETDRTRFLALLNLGIVEALSRELIGLRDAEEILFHAANCSFVADACSSQLAQDIMGRGVQLSDLIEALPKEAAGLELQRELNALRNDSVAILRDLEVRKQETESKAGRAAEPRGRHRKPVER